MRGPVRLGVGLRLLGDAALQVHLLRRECLLLVRRRLHLRVETLVCPVYATECYKMYHVLCTYHVRCRLHLLPWLIAACSRFFS